MYRRDYLARVIGALCPDVVASAADQSAITAMLSRFRDTRINIDERTIKFFGVSAVGRANSPPSGSISRPIVAPPRNPRAGDLRAIVAPLTPDDDDVSRIKRRFNATD